MTEQERNMLEQVKQIDVAVPESLKPENLEKVLRKTKKTAWWKNRKFYEAIAATFILVVGLNVFSLQNKERKTLEVKPRLATAESYDEVYKCIKAYQKEMNQGFSLFEKAEAALEGGAFDVSADTAVPESSSVAQNNGASDTNVRTEGVGEADVVKTNGLYLFVMQDNMTEISIVDARTEKMEELARIQAESDTQIAEFYVKNDKVYLFTDVARSQKDKNGNEVFVAPITCVETYDISNVSEPKKVASTEQSGYYQSSRISGDYIYVFSNYYVYSDAGKANIETYIPMVEAVTISERDIFMPETNASQYVVITSLNINEPDKIVDHKAVLTNHGICYVSTNNIYIYEAISRVSPLRNGNSNEMKTCIRKIAYDDGKLHGVAQGVVKGWINDSFSIDEYEGNLRIVTTINGHDTMTNSVYVLNKEMEIIGEINGLAKDERVYSARLFGDTGYFVTYRETDPLFSVDFSNPENPKIIGKLKIPGFSEYLHFYGKDQLVGIGMDTEEESGITNGVKLSMFDISDPTDVKEVHTYTIEDMYSADLFWDYKAVLIDYEKNIIGFSCYDLMEKYCVFSYDEERGFIEEMREYVTGGSYLSTRGVYVEDRLYVIKGRAIESYRLGTFEKIDDILL